MYTCAKYTSHAIQKELLLIMSSKVKPFIREEIGDSKFCIIVDESRDESLKEQMAIILRFVDKNGCVQERFFERVHVDDTMTITLKKKFVMFFLGMVFVFHISAGKGMMVLVT